METICLQCGDRGFNNAFVYCVRCLDFAVHRYCLDVIPMTFNEFVHWVCEDCEVEVQSQLHVHKHDDGLSHTKCCKVSENMEGFLGNKTKENDLVVVQTQTDSPKHSSAALEKTDSGVCGDESASRSPLIQGKNDEELEVEKDKANLKQPVWLQAGRRKKRTKKMKTKWTRKKRKRNRNANKIPTIEQPNKERLEVEINGCASSASGSTVSSKGIEGADPGIAYDPLFSCNGHSRKKQKIVPLSELVSRNDHAESRELEDNEKRTSATPHNSNTCIVYTKYLHAAAAEPVVMPIWRGSFSILNKKNDKLEELVAHVSSKACHKVYEAAAEFESMLQFTMFPRSEIWPESFQMTEPTGDSIALYFFPSETSKQVFDCLIEKMMSKELGLKAVMQNAELLIFTSTDLPLRYWRFRSKYYLWGVFRGRQSPSS